MNRIIDDAYDASFESGDGGELDQFASLFQMLAHIGNFLQLLFSYPESIAEATHLYVDFRLRVRKSA